MGFVEHLGVVAVGAPLPISGAISHQIVIVVGLHVWKGLGEVVPISILKVAFGARSDFDTGQQLWLAANVILLGREHLPTAHPIEVLLNEGR